MPEGLRSCAKIDGAGELTIFTRIMLPLSKPAIAVVVLLQFIFTWRDYIGPLIYLNDDDDGPQRLDRTEKGTRQEAISGHLVQLPSLELQGSMRDAAARRPSRAPHFANCFAVVRREAVVCRTRRSRKRRQASFERHGRSAYRYTSLRLATRTTSTATSLLRSS